MRVKNLPRITDAGVDVWTFLQHASSSDTAPGQLFFSRQECCISLAVHAAYLECLHVSLVSSKDQHVCQQVCREASRLITSA